MRLLCIIPFYYPAFQYGGPIASVHGLNKALVDSGIDVTVYTTNAGQSEALQANTELKVDGVKVVYFQSIFSWFFSVEMTKALKDNISDYDFVYVNGLWNYPAAVACYYSRAYHKPYIIAPRGMLYRYTMGKKIWKKWPYYQLIAKRDIQGASAMHYTTNDEAEQCHTRLGLKSKVLVIPNGVDPSLYAHCKDDGKLREKYPVLKGKKIVLFLSRISWKKGLDILVKSFGIIAKKRDDIHLLIVGPDESGYKEKVSKWLDSEGIKDKATFTGLLKGSEKIDAFAASDVFALASYSENFGMVVVEAMACGLPVVISDQVGLCDDVEKAKAGIVIETDAGQLAGALTQLLDNPDLCVEMGGRGKMLVANEYGWSQIASSMINALKELDKVT